MPKEKIRVLLIEDDEDDYILIKTALRKVPQTVYSVTWEKDCEKALDRILSGSHDIYLLDNRLGQKTGLEIIQEAQQKDSQRPMILLTGTGNEDLGLSALRAGAEDYLVKSEITPPILERAIRYAIERRETVTKQQELIAVQAARTQAEKEREVLSTLFEEAPALIGILRGREGRVELFNTLFKRLWGNREVIGKPMREAFHELEGQGWFEILEQVYDTGKPVFGTEKPAKFDRNNDGILEEAFFNFVYQPTYDEKGTVNGVAIYGIEVTNQVLSRQALAASEERLDLAQKAGKIGTYEWLIDENRIIWTPQLEALYGLARGAFEGNYDGWAKRLHPADRALVEKRLDDALKGGPPFNVEFKVIWPDGSEHWLLAKGDVFFDKEGHAKRVIGVNIDITERKNLESQKDEFIGVATHELKTPVTTLKGYTQLLLNRMEKAGEKDHAAHLSKMDAQLNRLNSLISDLLDVTKIQAGKLKLHSEEFAFDELVTETIESMQHTTDRHTLVIESSVTKLLTADRDRIGQVMSNLLSNAIKYSPHSDKIIIKTTNSGDSLKFSVQDFGIGISKNMQDKIFERFFRESGPTEITFPGLGLGLYISAEIIRQHGGNIWVESVKGKGSIFHFSLPIKKSKKNKRSKN